jgi:hypothetical protein
MIIRESRRQAAFRLVGCAGFVAVCVWMLTSSKLGTLPPNRADNVTAISWIGAAFFGLLAFRYAWSLLKPGTLIISPTGISQNLGWRSRHWRWSEIESVELRRTAANLVSVCLLHPFEQGPIRLFGWQRSPEELYGAIEEGRARYSNSTLT